MSKTKTIEIEVTRFKVEDDDDNLERVDITQIPPPKPGDVLILFYSSGWCSYTKVIQPLLEQWSPNDFSTFGDGRIIPPRWYFIVNSAVVDAVLK